jgi:iron(III) transport system substrate-binding protein
LDAAIWLSGPLAVGRSSESGPRQDSNHWKCLLSEAGQTHFAEENAEFPVTPEVQTPQGLPSIVELAPPAIEFSTLADLESAVRILQTTGAL